MLRHNRRNVSGIYAGGLTVVRVYLGDRLVWRLSEASDSCYGSGLWLGDQIWLNDDNWTLN